MTLKEAIDEFLLSCVAAGRSPATVGWYKRRLKQFLSFVGDVSLESVTIGHLRRFLAQLREIGRQYEDHPYREAVDRPLSEYTIAGYVRSLKTFFNWLESDQYITASQNVASRLKRVRLPKLPPKSASLSDIQALLRAARDGQKSVFLAKRDFAVVMFLAHTGCRVGGLVHLRLSDLNIEEGSALVTEKGQKSRYVFFSDETKQALREWLEVRPSGSEFLFVGERGPLTGWGVNQLLSRLKKRAGVDGRVNPHSFRHYFARDYLLNGGDLASLSDLMGHADVVVTKNSYSVFLKEELKRKHDRYSSRLVVDAAPEIEEAAAAGR